MIILYALFCTLTPCNCSSFWDDSSYTGYSVCLSINRLLLISQSGCHSPSWTGCCCMHHVYFYGKLAILQS